MTVVLALALLLISFAVLGAAMFTVARALDAIDQSEHRAHDLAVHTVREVSEAVSEAIAPKPIPPPVPEPPAWLNEVQPPIDPTEHWLPTPATSGRVGDGRGIIPEEGEITQPLSQADFFSGFPEGPNMAGEDLE